MTFVGVTPGRFPAKMRALRAHPGPPPQASLWATFPTLEISGQVPRVPGVVSVELVDRPATPRTARFPVAHTSRQVSHPRRGREAREELGTWDRAGGLASVPRRVQWAPGGRDPRPWMVLPWGVGPVHSLDG